MPRLINWMLIFAVFIGSIGPSAIALAVEDIPLAPLTPIAALADSAQQPATPADVVDDVEEEAADPANDVMAIDAAESVTVATIDVAVLNVRGGPGLNYSIFTQVFFGEIYPVIGGPIDASDFSWVQLELSDSTSGWVASEYVLLHADGEPTTGPIPAETSYANIQPGDQVRVDVSILNIRSGPGTSYSVVSQARLGQTYVVLGGPVTANGFDWIQIDLPGTPDGWVAAQYLTRIGSAPPSPTTTPTVSPSPSPTWTPTDTATPTLSPTPTPTETAAPSPSSTHTPPGSATETPSPTWTPTATEPAIVSPTPTRVPGIYIAGDTVKVIPRLNVRAGPGTNYAVRRVALPGETGTVLSGNTAGGQFSWIQVRFSDITGWVATAYVELIDAGPLVTPSPTVTRTPSVVATATPTKSAGLYQPGDVVVVTDSLNVRSGAGTSYGILGLVTPDTQGTVLTGNTPGGSYQWIRVRFPSLTGWVATNWVTHLGMASPTPTASTTKITVSLNCTSNPERITITNNNASAVTIISIGTLYQPLSSEPFALYQTLGAGQSRTYLAGSQASGQFSLTSSFILTDSAGSNDGVTVVTSAGTVIKRCAAAVSQARWVEVDLSQQYMRVYQGTSLIAGTYVSTGRYGFDTPVGTYYTWLKYTSQTMSGCIQGECYVVPNVPWVHYFTYQGHAIHGAYWHNNFGVRMSHGCVNLPVPFAEWLYYWLPMGSRVVVKQ